MTRLVSEVLSQKWESIPSIKHNAIIDMEGPILAAEIIAFLLQQHKHNTAFDNFVELICNYFQGCGGLPPTKKSMEEAKSLRNALDKWNKNKEKGKHPPANSILTKIAITHQTVTALELTGVPDKDWRVVRSILDASNCPRLKNISDQVRNIRLLERGTQLRQNLVQDWLDNGAYKNALNITRHTFIQEHFSTTLMSETGVLVMNMHKAKGKQFDEVIIFEGWPRYIKHKTPSNPDRIVRNNKLTGDTTQARQNFRVSITRAKNRTTILTPANDPCVLLPST